MSDMWYVKKETEQEKMKEHYRWLQRTYHMDEQYEHGRILRFMKGLPENLDDKTEREERQRGNPQYLARCPRDRIHRSPMVFALLPDTALTRHLRVSSFRFEGQVLSLHSTFARAKL